MCMVLLHTPGGAAGRGIQALRVGFTASRSKPFSASVGKATRFASSHASRRTGLALRWSIRIDNSAGAGRGVRSIELDGQRLPNGAVPLLDDDKTHEVAVHLG